MASLFGTVRDLDRLRQISLVLARHGFGEVLQRTGLASLAPGARTSEAKGRLAFAERVRLVLEELGPSFVKLGQLASTRPDLVPPDVVAELSKLQDEVPPVPFEEMRTVLESELGAPAEDLFERLDETPLASASIGQVHRAAIRRGDDVAEVVVKLQRPRIREIIERDIDLLYLVARLIERSIPETRIYSPVRLVREFDRAIAAELDFTQEADNAERFAENFEGWTTVHFPAVHRQLSSKRVITLEYLAGKKVHAAVADGASGQRIATAAVEILVKMIFEDGLFHADPHPGNILILGPPEEPVIGLIDLGLVGRLTPQLRDRTIELMVAAVRRDYRAMADALYAIGRPTRKVDRQAFEAEVTVMADRYLGRQLRDFELGALIRDLVDSANRFGIEVPPDFLLVGKSLMTLEGIGRSIYPELDVFDEVRPYALKLMWRRFTPERLGPDVLRSLLRLGGAATEMPLQLQEIFEDLRTGALQLQIHPRTVREAADNLGRRLFTGVVVSALVLAAAVLLAADEDVPAAVAVGLAAAGLGWQALVGAWRALRGDGRER